MRWTLPNILTLARICLTPVIALLPFIEGYWPKVIAFLIFLAAGASDVVDGYLARRRNQVSELGQLLDPVADKLLLFAMLIPIFWLTRHPTILYGIPWWGSLPVWVALLLVGRELLITAFRFFARRRGVVIPAVGAGKLKAVVQNVFIGATIAWFAWRDALLRHGWTGPLEEAWNKFHGWFVADEDVLHHGLELPRAHRRDHHAAPSREKAKGGDEQLPSHQEQRHPHRQAAPPGNPVQDGRVAREPEDGNQHREQQQLVRDGIEQLAELAHLVAPAGGAGVHDVRSSGREEDQERDHLGPVPLDEGEQRDDRRETDAREREDVGQGPAHSRGDRSLAERLQNHFAHRLQGVEHAVAAHRHRLEVRGAADPLVVHFLDQVLAGVRGIGRDFLLRPVLDRPPGIERRLEVAHRRRIGEVALVVLDDERDLRQVVAVLGHVVVQVLHRLDVGLHTLDLAVRDEHDPVHPFEDELPAGVVVHLPRHRVEVEPRLEAADGAQVHREEVEKQGALRLGGEGDHLAARVGRDFAIDVLEIRGLAAQPGAVVHELAVDLAGRVVDHRHGARE